MPNFPRGFSPYIRNHSTADADAMPPPEHFLDYGLHEFSSMSFQTSWILSLFSFAICLFLAVRLSRSARRHLFTSRLAPLHLPNTLCKKPCAWHSSRAAMTSSQPGGFLEDEKIDPDTRRLTGREGQGGNCEATGKGASTSVIFCMEMRMHFGLIRAKDTADGYTY